MAQTEDTELRDLVIEALERNGSLAKIRALLRANVFLAFEDDRENVKQNICLDNILKHPEGILSLSIVHEFLEFCNLKNTLFVYMSESRQRKEYNYEGPKVLADKLNILKRESLAEPLLVTLIKNCMKPCQRKYYDQGDGNNQKTNEKNNDNNFKDEQNCTYIVHEDSGSATSNSNSDNSSDEKNKLHLQLQLDNSDTDTSSSDSMRDKSSSEYIPSEHVVKQNENTKVDNRNIIPQRHSCGVETRNPITTSDTKNLSYLQNLKMFNNSSSESTSYVDLKPFNPKDKKLLNTTGVPLIEADEEQLLNSMVPQSASNLHSQNLIMDSIATASLSSNSSPTKTEEKDKSSKTGKEESGKTDVETAEYSYDFSSSPVTKNVAGSKVKSPSSLQEEKSPNKNASLDSPHQNSQSSQSSVSISDVADLISEKSVSFSQHHKEKMLSEKSNLHEGNDYSKKLSTDRNKSDDSVDFSESPVPSLSNLSLDIHSD